MSDALARILVLGAYSVIGRDIVKGLLDQTDCAVTATGRSRLKLDQLGASLTHPRLSVSILDALDLHALGQACRDADIVVNCVGPYIVSGYDVAKTVVECRKHYVDFAFEQFHYRRLKTLDQRARALEVALVTAAGETAGISSILGVHAADKLPALERLTVCFLDGTLRDADSGFSGFMNGALEPALENEDYIDGRYVVSRMGADVIERVFPEPWGRASLLSDPTIDALTFPEGREVRTIKSYFGLGMDIPFGFFPLMRLLNPYKNRIFYRWTGRIVRNIMRKNHTRQAGRRALPREPLLTVEAESRDQRLAMEVRLQRRLNGTSILPVLICKMLARRQIGVCGLRTAMDIVTPQGLFRDLERYRELGVLSWTIGEPSAA